MAAGREGRDVDGESPWERFRGLERRQMAGLAAVAVLIVAAAALWYVRSLPSRVRVEAALNGGGVSGSGSAAAGSPVSAASPLPSSGGLTPGGVIVVDVAGWVRHPGVYQFHQGDRVIDAIRRAGGARPGADLTSINLAALLSDALQIVVGRVGAGGGPVSSVGGGSSGTSGTGGTSLSGLIDINSATLDQLESLPGIGPALGQRIIDYRQAHGPFHSIDDLLNVSGIGDQRLADIRSKVTV
jgi:competence protein ComEA